MSKLIFEVSRRGRRGYAYPELDVPSKEAADSLGPQYLRIAAPDLPELSEVDVVRHYINLSRKNYGVDLGFYPLGSCTMKYNPKINEDLASLPGFMNLHPLQPVRTVQGILRLLHETTTLLCEITGMKWGTLQPLAGAHGEFTGMKLFRAYFNKRGEHTRTRILVPDSSHGTNPASAHIAGFEVVELPSNREGMVSLEELDNYLDENLAGIMLTNPNTLGLFEKDIKTIAGKVHKAGGLLYYDGANSNAIMGKVRPGDMGFDVVHLNLHKTFSTPHGGGGPGSGPVLVSERIVPFLPIPDIVKSGDAYSLDHARPDSIGRVAGFFGNVGIVIRAYAYMLTMGAEGLKKASEYAVLNANYLKEKLKGSYRLPYDVACKHEFVLSAKELKDNFGVTALDIAKRLLDYGVHPPTIYFPMIVPEALMIEPTETESRESLDAFIDVMGRIRDEAEKQPELLKEAPTKTPVRRIDEVLAAKQPVLRFKVRPLETMLNKKHKGLDAKMVEFGGWEMPLQYSNGILQEHLATRKGAGLFDISHMGRFIIRGAQGLAFLQHVLTGNAAALTLKRAQYTMIANESGGAIDDCYLYRFHEEEYLLVVNAANSPKDWEHLERHRAGFPETEMLDKTKELAMLSLQGPESRRIMEQLLPGGGLPEPGRNNLSIAALDSKPLFIARTGYTGEPLGFELFADSAQAESLWSRLIELGAVPVGLGARDSLRLEAGLPLYGNELGLDPEGKEIPIFALSLARFAVSFHPDKGDFIGRLALQEQFNDHQKILDRDFDGVGRLKRTVQPIALLGKGVARHGDKVFFNDRQVGWITSGTVVPYWKTTGEGLESRLIDETGKRPVCLGLIDSSLLIGQDIDIAVRGKRIKAVVVPHHMRSEAPPHSRAICYGGEGAGTSAADKPEAPT
jgi:glycine dehydrogenase subunit 2